MANWISFGNFLLTIAVFVVTYLLFKQTQKATKAATDSAEAAINTYKQQRFNDSVMRYRDSVNSIANNINERNRFMIDSASAATQIQSLKENQRQFNKANDSYIQLLRFHTISLKENGEAKFGYYIQNLGQPAKITKSYTHAFPDIPNKDTFSINEKIRKYQRKSDAKNLFLTKEIQQHEVFGKNFSTDTLELVKWGAVHVYFFGEMFYTNLVTNKPKSYKFTVEFDVTTNGYKYLEAENFPKPLD